MSVHMPWWIPIDAGDPVGVEQLARELASGDGPHVVDVRSEPEFRAGHVPGARRLRLHRLDQAHEVLDEGRPVVAVSLTGRRAAVAANRLRTAGYDAGVLDGGMRSWWQGDYPTLQGVEVGRGQDSVLPFGAAGDVEDADGYRRAMEALVGVPATDGNRLVPLRNGVEIFPAMLDAIERAQRTVDLLTFVYWQGEIAHRFADALSARARSGVRVRVLLDAVGARYMRGDLVRRLRGSGARVQFFRPPSRQPVAALHRTHRKVLVCDDRIGFTGGVGIADEWRGDAGGPDEWRDTHFLIEGPAVDGLRAAFLGNWMETGGSLAEDFEHFDAHPRAGDVALQVLRSQPAASGITDVEMALRAMIRLARHRLRITTAYFTPDRPFLRLLRDAAARGVTVEVLVPGPHADKRMAKLAGRSAREALTRAGIGVSLYQPTMLHAKVITVDGLVACVGSVNINSRSLSHDDEAAVVVHHRGVVSALDAHFDEDLAASRPLDADSPPRSLMARARERVASLVDPFL